MSNVVNVLVALIAVEHVYFLVLEMFLWTKPKGLKVFGMSQEKADSSAVLAMNQGLYNGFLVVALVLSLVLTDPEMARGFQLYGLGCVTVAGIFGGITVNNRILFLQAAPAALTLLLTFL